MEICKNCKFWDQAYWDQGDVEKMLGLGQCTRVPLLLDVVAHVVDATPDYPGEVRLKNEAQGLMAFTHDYESDFRAGLLTLPDFGCVQFQPAT